MPIEEIQDVLSHPDFQSADAPTQADVLKNYWAAYDKENPEGAKTPYSQRLRQNTLDVADIKLRQADADPVTQKALEYQRQRINADTMLTINDQLGGFETPEARKAFVEETQQSLAKQKEDARQSLRLIDGTADEELKPVFEELKTTAIEGGIFGDPQRTIEQGVGDVVTFAGEAVSSTQSPSRVDEGKQRYTQARNGFAETFGLTTEQADDYLKHKFDLQTEKVSRDVMGQIHVKDDLLAKPVDEIQKEIAASNIPDASKETLKEELPQRLAAFKVKTVENVVQNHPEFAAELGVSTNDVEGSFGKITKDLNDSRTEQALTGVASAFGKSVSQAQYVGSLFEDKLDFSDKTPYLEKRSREIERRQKFNESLTQISGDFNKDKVSIFGTDAAVIGQGIYSAAESVAVGAATAGLGNVVIGARALKAAPTLAKFSKAALNVAPVAGLAGTRQGFDTYEQAIKAGASPEEAQKLGLRSGAIEMGVTMLFSGIGAGGVESIGQTLADPVVKKGLAKAIAGAVGGVASENIEEMAITALDTATVQAKINPNLTVDDLKKSLYDTMVATTVAAGLAEGGKFAIERAAQDKPTYEQTDAELERNATKTLAEKDLPEAPSEGRAVPVGGEAAVAAAPEVKASEIQTPSPTPATLPGGTVEGAGVGTNLPQNQNDNQQPTTPPQLEVPVSDVPADDAGAEGTDVSSTVEPSLPPTTPTPLTDESQKGNRQEIQGRQEVLKPETAGEKSPVAPSKTTALKNAKVDADMRAAGLEPVLKQAAESNQDTWDAAMSVVENDPTAGSKLVDDLNNDGTLKNVTQEAVLLHELAIRKAEVANARMAMVKNPSPENSQKLQQAQARFADAAVASKNAGSLAGKLLQFRQRAINEDFSLVAMEARVITEINEGAPLTKDQSDLIERLQKELESSNNEIDVLRVEIQEKEDAILQLTILDLAAKEAKRNVPRKDRIAKYANELSDRAAEARKRLRGKLFTPPSNEDQRNYSFGGLDQETINDLITVGADLIAKGARTLKQFTTKLIEEFGDAVKSIAPQLFEASKQRIETTRKEAKAPKAPRTPEQIKTELDPNKELSNADVYNMVRGYLAQGIEKEEVLDKVLADLQEVYPSLTYDEVSDAFTGYGKIKFPNAEELATQVRELRDIERIQRQIREVEAGRAPKKTGQQRDKATEEIRNLQKELKAAFKKAGISTKAETSLKSPLEATKTRFANEIEDRRAAIEARRPLPDKGPRTPYDEETQRLADELAKVREEYRTAFADPAADQALQVKRAVAALDRRIAAEEELLLNGLLSRPKTAKAVLNDPEITRREARLKSLRDARNALKKTKRKSPAQIALEAALRANREALARDRETVRTGILPTKTKAAPKYTPTQELKDILAERATLKQIIKKQRAAQNTPVSEEERAIKAVEKSIALLDKRIEQLSKGIVDPKAPPKAVPLSVTLARAIRNSRKATADAMERALKVTKSPEEIAEERAFAALASRINKLEDKIRRGDVRKDVKKDPVTSARIEKERLRFEKAKQEWNKLFLAAEYAKATKAQKASRLLRGLLQLRKIVVLGGDIGVVLRQLGAVTYRNVFHPTTMARMLYKAIKAGFDFTEKSELAAYDATQNVPEAALYKQAGMHFHSPFDEGYGNKEDIPDPEFLNIIKNAPAWKSLFIGKGLAQTLAMAERFQRAYLNTGRYEMFHALVEAAGGVDAIDKKTAALIGNAVMIGTGRWGGDKKTDFGRKLESAIPALNATFFISARYSISRLALAVGQPIFTGKGGDITENKALRARIAYELYVKSLMGRAIVMGLVGAAYGAGGGDDEKDKKWKGVLNPRDKANFMKLKVGDTRIDMSSGIGPYISQVALLFGAALGDPVKVDRRTGKETAMKPREVANELVNFQLNRANINAAFVARTILGEYYGGRPVTTESAIKEFLFPIMVNDIQKIAKEHGPEGVAVWAQMMLGDGVQPPGDFGAKPKVTNPYQKAPIR